MYNFLKLEFNEKIKKSWFLNNENASVEDGKKGRQITC